MSSSVHKVPSADDVAPDVLKITYIRLHTGMNAETGEQHVILDVELEDGSRRYWALPYPYAQEFAAMLAQFVDAQSN